MNTEEDRPPTEPTPTDAKEAVAPGQPAALSPQDLIALNEELAGMARAGLPLDQGLAALAREMGRGRLQRVTEELAADLHAGHTLPDALARQGERVPPFYAGLVAAGIRTGRITDVLATLTIYARTLADLRSLVLGALLYPAVLLVLAFTLFALLCGYLLPQFVEIFNDLKLKLPALTEWVIAVGMHPLEYVVLPVVVVIGIVLAISWLLRRTPGGRRHWARFVYALPIAGTLVRSARLAAFTDLLGILVDNGVPLPEAFRLAGAAASDPVTASAAEQVEADLRQGQPLGDVLRKRKLVPELISWMAGLGERRGTLGATLHQVAAIYRRQVETRAALLRTVLPPLVIIVTAGIIVGLFVLALMLPFFSLLEGLSGAKK
jgi:type II secretory pathway component PulF